MYYAVINQKRLVSTTMC